MPTDQLQATLILRVIPSTLGNFQSLAFPALLTYSRPSILLLQNSLTSSFHSSLPPSPTLYTRHITYPPRPPPHPPSFHHSILHRDEKITNKGRSNTLPFHSIPCPQNKRYYPLSLSLSLPPPSPTGLVASKIHPSFYKKKFQPLNWSNPSIHPLSTCKQKKNRQKKQNKKNNPKNQT